METWLREQESATGLDHRRQRLDLRGAPRRLRRRRPALRPRPVLPVPDGAARPARGVRARRRSRSRSRRATSRTSTRARCACSSTAGRSSSRATCSAACRPATWRRSSRTGICATAAASLHLVLLGSSLALARRGGVYRAALARPARLPRRGGRAARPAALLHARDLGDREGAPELPPRGRAGRVGEGRGHEVNRAADVAVAGFGLLVAAPVLGIAAAAVKLADGGPVLYRQQRVGKDGVEFELLKLRTMVVGAETTGRGLRPSTRATRASRGPGTLLRRLSIDELPQLWNVIRGDMSVIGPRPTLALPGRALHGAPAAPPRGQAGPDRLGAGARSRTAAVGRAHRARRLVRRAPLAARRPEDPRCARRSRSSAGRTRARPAAGATPRESLDRAQAPLRLGRQADPVDVTAGMTKGDRDG